MNTNMYMGPSYQHMSYYPAMNYQTGDTRLWGGFGWGWGRPWGFWGGPFGFGYPFGFGFGYPFFI